MTISVTLWITAFYEKPNIFCITLQYLKEFYHFTAKLMNKSHSPQWEFGNIFQIVEQKYAKPQTVGRFDTYESFLKCLQY